MTHTLTAATFYMGDEDRSFEGFTDGSTWNGWQNPYFTEGVAKQVIAWLSEDETLNEDTIPALQERMDAPVDTAKGLLYYFGGGLCWEVDGPQAPAPEQNPPELFSARTVMVNALAMRDVDMLEARFAREAIATSQNFLDSIAKTQKVLSLVERARMSNRLVLHARRLEKFVIDGYGDPMTHPWRPLVLTHRQESVLGTIMTDIEVADLPIDR